MEVRRQVIKHMLGTKEEWFAILHLKDTPELDRCHFWGTEQLKALGDYEKVMKIENYEVVYMADFAEFPDLMVSDRDDTLELIWTRFNADKPEDYKAHSLSVSDVVILHMQGLNSIHYVDSFGFTEVPEFMKELLAD